MCCLFTCCGWMIDLIQRLWTFTMSCCISSAVCCALLTASISGIALGYNYSLAEYIDLKETNVSVYLKRGIFDDEIGDDMDWRRSGHQPVAGHIGEKNLMTGEPEEDRPLRSGRRLDDSIYESEDRNRFEGSLMKLTAKPPAPSPTPESVTTVDADKILSKYPMGSMDQMKALQSLINMRKVADPRRMMVKEEKLTPEPVIDERYHPYVPVDPSQLTPGRRLMPLPPIPGMTKSPGNSARLAVPAENINDAYKWRLPKLPPDVFTRDDFGDYDVRPTYPMPVTQRTGPVRPTRPKPVARPRPTATSRSTPLIGREEPYHPKSIDEDMDAFKDKLLFDAPPSFQDENFIKNAKGPKQDDDDYGDALKGVPLRKKRHFIVFEKFKILESNNSSIHDPSIRNTSTIDVNNGLLYRVRESVNNVKRNEINEEVVSSNDRSQVSTTSEAISAVSSSTSNILSSNTVLKLLKTI